MEVKKIIGTFLVGVGFLGLVPGVLGIFERKEYLGLNSWALVVLGFVFFSSGVGLLQSIRRGAGTSAGEPPPPLE